jgi:predicted DNA-binding transcriptional regulator AlpA
MSAPESFLDVQQTCARIGKSRASVYRLLTTCRFPEPFQHGGRTLFKESDIVAWLERMPRGLRTKKAVAKS